VVSTTASNERKMLYEGHPSWKAYFGYYLVTDPNGAAGAAKDVLGSVWDGLQNLFAAMINFINALFA